MMQNGRINSPMLRPRLSSSESQNQKNMSTWLEIEVSIKIKYGHEGIMILLETKTYINIYCHMISYVKVPIYSQCQV